MGQAVAELPDPLEMPPPATMSSTDDVISQIAGDEIDRLMAESQTEAEPVAAAVSAPAVATPAAAATEVPAPASPAADELKNILDHLSEGDAPAKPQAVEVQAPAVTATVAPATSEQPVAPVAPVAAAAAASVSEPVTTTAERNALALGNLPAATDAAEHHDAVKADEVHAAKPSLVVRLLEGVNAPVSFVSDATRDMIGKVAIVTMANAIAVLVYVLLFRR